jgi:hypothetical protein
MLDRFRKSELWCNVLWWFYNPFFSRLSIENFYEQRVSNVILEMDESEKQNVIREIESKQHSQIKTTIRLIASYIFLMLMTFLLTNSTEIKFNAYGFQLDSLSKLREIIFVLAASICFYIELQSIQTDISRKVLGKIKFGSANKEIKVLWLSPFYYYQELVAVAPRTPSGGQALTGVLILLVGAPVLISVIMIPIIAYIYFTVELVANPVFSKELTIFLVGLADTLFLGSLLLSIYVRFPFNRLRPHYLRKFEAITALESPRAEAEFWRDIGSRQLRAKMLFLRLRGVTFSMLGKDELEKRILKNKRRIKLLRESSERRIRSREKALARRRRKK